MKTSTVAATPTTEARWRERVRLWRESGQSAREFARERGFAPGTLQWWSSRLHRSDTPRFVRLVPRTAVAPDLPAAPDLVVEIGGARVRVTPGFDAALLAQVVRVLGGGAR